MMPPGPAVSALRRGDKSVSVEPVAVSRPEMPESIETVIQNYGKRIDPLIEEEFPPDRYPFLSEGARYQLHTGGKRLRPALCLLTCEGLGGEAEKALPFACASEILHNLFLLHDDIEDGDRKRRDQDTVWVKFGIPNAINIGDFLAAKAYEVLLKSPVRPETLIELVKVFTDTYLVTTRGQALDINLRASENLTLEQYLEIVSLKTARYLAYNMVGGAIVAGAGKEIQDRFWEVGSCLGPAFQIQDDILDLTKNKGRGGQIGCDIAEGKPTIFLAYLLESRPEAEMRRRLVEILGKPREETTSEDIQWVIALYEETGAVEFARKKAVALARRAAELVEKIPLSNRELFVKLCRYVAERRI